MKVRPARPADLDGLVELEQAFPTDRLSRRQWRHMLTRAHAAVWVAEDGSGRLEGDAIVTFRRGFDGARLYSLVVAPDARGSGVGRALLEAAERSARERGCVSLRLEVREDNQPALALYHRHGFELVGTSEHFYGDGGTALRMRKRLSGPGPSLDRIPYVPQTLPFTCGPACLMMAMRALGSDAPSDAGQELTLWREATTVFLAGGPGGCSPHGLAVAALRRGFVATVHASDDGVPFLHSVRRQDKREVLNLAHRQFLAELERLGGELRVGPFGVERVDETLRRGEVPILLVSGMPLYGERVPHWVLVTGADDTHLYLHDPWIPEGAQRADGVHLPLPRGDFPRVARYGRRRQRYLVTLADAGSPTR